MTTDRYERYQFEDEIESLHAENANLSFLLAEVAAERDRLRAQAPPPVVPEGWEVAYEAGRGGGWVLLEGEPPRMVARVCHGSFEVLSAGSGPSAALAALLYADRTGLRPPHAPEELRSLLEPELARLRQGHATDAEKPEELRSGIEELIADLKAVLAEADRTTKGMSVPYCGMFADVLRHPSTLRDIRDIVNRLEQANGR